MASNGGGNVSRAGSSRIDVKGAAGARAGRFHAGGAKRAS